MFQFTGLPSIRYGFTYGCMESVHAGCPIRKSPDRWICAPPRSFSQLITSFIGCQCQGIRPAPFLLTPTPCAVRVGLVPRGARAAPLNPVRPSVGYLGSSHISPRQREIWRQQMVFSGLKSSGSSPGLLRCPLYFRIMFLYLLRCYALDIRYFVYAVFKVHVRLMYSIRLWA